LEELLFSRDRKAAVADHDVIEYPDADELVHMAQTLGDDAILAAGFRISAWRREISGQTDRNRDGSGHDAAHQARS
jgi:hypothetical protein